MTILFEEEVCRVDTVTLRQARVVGMGQCVLHLQPTACCPRPRMAASNESSGGWLNNYRFVATKLLGWLLTVRAVRLLEWCPAILGCRFALQIPSDVDVVPSSRREVGPFRKPTIVTFHGNAESGREFDRNTVFISRNQAQRMVGRSLSQRYRCRRLWRA